MWFAIDYPERASGLILHSSAVPGPVPATMPRLLAQHDFLYWAAVRAVPGMLLGLLLPQIDQLDPDRPGKGLPA